MSIDALPFDAPADAPDRPAIDAPSIVDAIRELYAVSDRRRPSTGYPTGSRLGTCAAQLQMLRFPDVSKPETTPVRTVMGWDEGHRTEEWLAHVLGLAFPNLVGLRQEPFYFPVALEGAGMVEDVAEQIRTRQGRRLWGTVLPGFQRPTVRVGDDGRVKLHLVPRGPDGTAKKLGFVLDPVRKVLFVPTFVDFILLHPRHGLMVLEAKSMSNWAFRRAVLGSLDYGKRAQLAGLRAATGCQAALIAYRKETHHLAEITYLSGEGRSRVILTRPNGQQEVFYPEGEGLTPEAGGAPTWPADATWEQARCEVWTPDDPILRTAIGERIRRVLFARPGEWFREYGPEFACVKCGGTGELVCRHCGGTGVTKKLGKPCGGECKDTRSGKLPCPGCQGKGALDEAELGFPCSYCPVIGSCWERAGLRLEIDEKPHYYVNRERYAGAGLSFVPPEPTA